MSDKTDMNSAKADKDMTDRKNQGITDHIRSVLRDEIGEQEVTGRRPFTSELKEQKGSVWSNDILWPLRHVNRREIGAFCREMSILLRAGVPILEGLRNVSRRTANTKLHHVLLRMGVMIENGHAFWEALERFPSVFPPLFVSSVRAGEVSGSIDAVLGRLAAYYEREYELRRRVGAALVYPGIIIVLAIAVCVVLSIFIMPVFVRLVEDFDADMPVLTEGIVNAVKLFPHVWGYVVAIPVILYIFYRFVLKKTLPGRLLIDRTKLAMPVIGSVSRKIMAARFARTFSILYHSGVPIIDALDIAHKAVGNEVAGLQMQDMRKSIERGESLEDSLKGQRAFPPLMVDMMIVGERSGRLGDVLPQIADIYEEDVSVTMSTIGPIIEPLLILAMGVIVAVVFAAFFLPYIRVLSAAGSSF